MLSIKQLVIKTYKLLFLYPKKLFNKLYDIFNELRNKKIRFIKDFIKKSNRSFKRIRVFLTVLNIIILFEFKALTDKLTLKLILCQAFNRFIKKANSGTNTGEPILIIVEI